MKPALALFAFCLMVPAVARADLSDSSWKLLAERAIVVVKQDGGEASGKLFGVDGSTVTLMTADGQILSIPRSEIRSVRMQPAGGTVAPSPLPVAPPPLAPPPPLVAPPPPITRLSNELERALPPLPPLQPPGERSMRPPAPPSRGAGEALSFLEVGALINELKTMKEADVVPFLDRDPRVPKLNAAQQRRIIDALGLSWGRRIGGIVLNFMGLVPGTGNLLQRDYLWGGILTGVTALGGIIMGGVGSKSFGGIIAGASILGIAYFTALVRSILYQPTDSLSPAKDYFSRRHQAKRGLELLPFAAVLPSLGGAPGAQNYQFGLQGRF